MTGWSIKGEAGKTLNATERSLAELNIDSASLTLASLADDLFTWTAKTANASGSGTIVPDAGQIVEVFYNSVRKFKGHVTLPRIRFNQVSVVVAGPWWWMNKIPLTSTLTDGSAATAERASYVFVTQALETSLAALIDKAIALGVPMARGSIATMFTFPRITISEQSCASALASLMSICPDAVASFDYSGTTPALNITRRGSMSATTLTIGTDAVEDVDLQPRLDLEVKKVTVDSLTRNSTTGATQFATQVSGTATAGKNQIFVVSGPEINDFLPKDKQDTVAVQSMAIPTNGVALGSIDTSTAHSSYIVTGSLRTFVIENDEAIATLIREWGSSFSGNLYLSNGGRFFTSIYTSGSDNGANTVFMDRPNYISKSSTSGMYLVISPTKIPEWVAAENGYVVTEATLTSYLRWTQRSTTVPWWWDQGAARAFYAVSGYQVYTTSASNNYERTLVFQSSIPVQLINANFSSLTTLYRAWDYDYMVPPSGLAAGLQAAQDWIPWEGRIQLVQDAVDGAQDLVKKFHLANALPACASMGALAKSIDYDIMRDRKIINLGAPAKTDFGSLATKFRRSPKDNIVYL